MGKTLADPLFLFLVAAVIAHGLLYFQWRRLSRGGRRALAALTAACTLLWLLGTHGAESHLMGRLSGAYPVPSAAALADIDVIIVLSGGYATAPVPSYELADGWTAARVIQGARTFKQSGARLFVVSGRASRDDPTRVVRSMKELAVELGVPPDRIVVEPEARTTRDHPVELKKLGIVGEGDTVGVVTSAWHLRRAMTEFQRHFPRLVAVPAFDAAIHQKTGALRWLPRSRHLASSATALSEYVGSVWYGLLAARDAYASPRAVPLR